MKTSCRYREFVIEADYTVGYIWSHIDYDGPEDNRCGWASTVDKAKEEIDERFYEGGEM